MTADLKTFKLKARGAAGSGRTQFLVALATVARGFGMQVHLVEEDHRLIVTSTAAQRDKLWRANQGAGK